MHRVIYLASTLTQEQLHVSRISHLTYSSGSRGSFRLRRPLAALFDDEFGCHDPIDIDKITVTSGLGGALDRLAWALCDEGEAILVPLPLYNGFQFELINRSNVRNLGLRY